MTGMMTLAYFTLAHYRPIFGSKLKDGRVCGSAKKWVFGTKDKTKDKYNTKAPTITQAKTAAMISNQPQKENLKIFQSPW